MGSAIWQVIVGLLVVAVGVLGLLIVAVMRQVGSILIRVSPARPGAIEGGPEVGSELDIPKLEKGRPAVLLFIAPGCGPCEVLRPSLSRFARNYADFDVVGIVVDEDEDSRIRYAMALDSIGRADLHELYEDWSVPGTPFAIGVDADHVVRRTGVVNHLDQLESLAESVLHAPPEKAAETRASTSGEIVQTGDVVER